MGYTSDYVDLAGDGCCSDRLISSNHYNLHTSSDAFHNRIRDSISWWIRQRNKSHKCQIIDWEIISLWIFE